MVGDDDDKDDDSSADEENIVPTNKVAAETADQLEKELDKFRQDWKKELFVEKRLAGGEEETESSVKNTFEVEKSKKGKNVAEYHSFPQRTSKPILKTGDLKSGQENNDEFDYEEPNNNEQKAQYLFDKGVQLEQQGRHYEGSK